MEHASRAALRLPAGGARDGEGRPARHARLIRVADSDIDELIAEALSDARKIESHLEEAAQNMRHANPQAACETIADAHYALGRIQMGHAEILRRFEAMGIEPSKQST
jgi:hypothetical protein